MIDLLIISLKDILFFACRELLQWYIFLNQPNSWKTAHLATLTARAVWTLEDHNAVTRWLAVGYPKCDLLYRNQSHWPEDTFWICRNKFNILKAKTLFIWNQMKTNCHGTCRVIFDYYTPYIHNFSGREGERRWGRAECEWEVPVIFPLQASKMYLSCDFGNKCHILKAKTLFI